MPKLSIIVPSFNQAEYLPEALDSVLRQTMDDWECLVVDDGSTDSSRDVIKTYAERDARFRAILQAQQGVSAARNAGISDARGEFLLFLDSDDLILPSLAETLLPALLENPGLDVIYGRHRVIDRFGIPTGLESGFRPVIDDYIQNLFINNLFQLNSAIVRKSSLERFSVRFSHELRPEDWAFWLDLALAGANFGRVNAVISAYRIHHQGRTRELMRRTISSEHLLNTYYHQARRRADISEQFMELAFIAMYIRRYFDSINYDDILTADYCRTKLKEKLSIRLIGRSHYHWVVLGRLLNLAEEAGLFPGLIPLVWLRRIKRGVWNWVFQ